MIEKKMENNEIVCAVTMVARKGKLVHHKAFGKADVEQNKILNKDDLFYADLFYDKPHNNCCCHDTI